MAMSLVKDWPENHPLYLEAQRMMGEWSQKMMAIARQKINEGDRSAAVAIVGQIPLTSPLYPQAQAQMTDWQQDWKRGEEIADKFQDALKEQNWQQASQQAELLLLLNIDYWREQQRGQLTQRMGAEKKAWQQLLAARKLLEPGTKETEEPKTKGEADSLTQNSKPRAGTGTLPLQNSSPAPSLDQLQAAIALAAKVNPKTYVKAKAEADRAKWSLSLLRIAAGRLNRQDFAGALDVAERVPADTAVYQQAQDWIILVRAQAAAEANTIPALIDALAVVRQIQPQSPVYRQAQVRESLWNTQLQDWLQLQFASAVASFDQSITFGLAVNQAQLISRNSSQNSSAQTLIANWRKQRQQVEDRMMLEVARQLAASGTMENLKAAVAKASSIQVGQPLRLDAQAAIAQWNRQIQRIEDQPTLDLARTFSQQGNLISAIQTAQQIRPGRALYPDAQVAINQWVFQLQAAEDQPILQAATALASQGRFSLAIQTAAQINTNRPLYKEAQIAIAAWTSQRDSSQKSPQASSTATIKEQKRR